MRGYFQINVKKKKLYKVEENYKDLNERVIIIRLNKNRYKVPLISHTYSINKLSTIKVTLNMKT